MVLIAAGLAASGAAVAQGGPGLTALGPVRRRLAGRLAGYGDPGHVALTFDDGPDPRAGRLVAEDEGAHPDEEEDLVARDVGIDGGGATAEEAAMHVVEEDDYDIRSE